MTSTKDVISSYFSKMGRKGAKARKAKLNPEERRTIASNAAKERWRQEAERKKGNVS